IMGQATSSIPSESDLGQFNNKLVTHFNIIKSLATVSHKDIVDCIEQLNTVTKSFTDRAGKQLRFLIQEGTDTTFIWKGTIRICCLKINTSNSEIESKRLLTLRQFVATYKEIIDQVSALSTADKIDALQPSSSNLDEMTTSAIFSAEKKPDTEEPINECCVCMDRRACVALSCCHEFCEICIDNWTRDERHSNCPMCRTHVSGSDDTWVMPRKSDTNDYGTDLKDHLVSIPDRSKKLT
ncbi:RING finger protein 141, partial [Biomphalaria glabrata]